MNRPEGERTAALSRRQMLRRSSVGLGSILLYPLYGGMVMGKGGDRGVGKGRQALKSQLTDGFEDGVDPDVWQATSFSSGEFRADDHCAIIDCATPGPKMNHGGFATRRKHVNPKLKGTNVLEATWIDYKSEGELIKGWVSPVYGPYSYGWTMTIGNYRGWTGEGIKTEGRKRSVQLIIDGWDSELGLDASWYATSCPATQARSRQAARDPPGQGTRHPCAQIKYHRLLWRHPNRPWLDHAGESSDGCPNSRETVAAVVCRASRRVAREEPNT